MKKSTYSYLTHVIESRGAAFLSLVDPDVRHDLKARIKGMCANGVDAILVGGSIVGTADFDEFVRLVKSFSTLPVIIFPGNSMQLSNHADAVLFLSLLSGRNPEYLIGEQVKASPVMKKMELEAIPTGYLLIESGGLTSVLFMSHTLPIPRDKADIAKYHALAAQYLGMKLVFLDAGSGAQESVPTNMISAIKDYVDIPVIAGGGIRNPDEARAKIDAGASAVVIGNVLEEKSGMVKDFAEAIHRR
jgi:putative glycerol-1-phosphate prenyltransferase